MYKNSVSLIAIFSWVCGSLHCIPLTLPSCAYCLGAMAKVSPCRTWEVRVSNYTEADIKFFESLECTAITMAKEVGEGGHHHLQGRITFKRGYRLTALKKLHASAHWEESKALADSNYCRKLDSDVFIDKGSFKRGARNDLESIRKKLKETNSIASIIEETNNYNNIKMCQAILTYKEPPRPVTPINVIWYWGDTGTGKTRAVYKAHPSDDIFRPINFKWWDGYDGHKVVLLDDFRKDFCKFHELLTLLDIYPYRVECKGGSRQIQAHTFYITSAFGPGELYDNREDIEQLLRRITEEYKFTSQGMIPINKGAREMAEAVAGPPLPDSELVD